MTLIIFVRHGESEANVIIHQEMDLLPHKKSSYAEMGEKLNKVGTDPLLSELGHKQAQNIANYLIKQLDGKPIKVISSTYARAIQTADPLVKSYDKILEYVTSELLIEYTHPDRKLSEEDTKKGIKTHLNWNDFLDDISEFIAFIEYKIKSQTEDVPIVIYGHSIYLSVLTSYLGSAKTYFPEKKDLVFRFPNTSITTYQYDKNRSAWNILNVANIRHIPQELLSGIECPF